MGSEVCGEGAGVRRGGSGYTSLSQESGMAAASPPRRPSISLRVRTSPARGRGDLYACAERRHRACAVRSRGAPRDRGQPLGHPLVVPSAIAQRQSSDARKCSSLNHQLSQQGASRTRLGKRTHTNQRVIETANALTTPGSHSGLPSRLACYWLCWWVQVNLGASLKSRGLSHCSLWGERVSYPRHGVPFPASGGSSLVFSSCAPSCPLSRTALPKL